MSDGSMSGPEPRDGPPAATNIGERDQASVPGVEQTDAARARSTHFTVATFRRTIRQPRGFIGIALLALMLLAAIAAPLIAPYDPLAQQAGRQLMPPTTEHIFGTDQFGRDIFSRVVFGARVSLRLSFLSVTLGASIGAVIGLMAGYLGGLLDTVTMRTADVILAYPGIILGVVVVAILGPGITQVAIAVAIINIPIFARLVRASTLKEKSLEYVMAARSLGAGNIRIMLRHITPNVFGSVLVQFTISMGLAVLLEAALSFLGLGAQPPMASWGRMLEESRPYLSIAPLYAVFPGLALATLMISLNFIADALRESLDPRKLGSL